MKGSSCIREDSEPNSEWANVMKNILNMDKPKSKNSMILSRAEKLDPKLEKDDDEDEQPNKISSQSLIKKEWLARGRCKPNPSEEGEKERKLRRVAVAGVIQLFNAVGKHQRANPTTSGTGSAQKSTSFKPLDKKSFFNILLGKDEVKEETQSGGDVLESNEPDVKDEIQEEEQKQEGSENNCKWDVLRNDFMMSTKLKDWDKQVDSS